MTIADLVTAAVPEPPPPDSDDIGRLFDLHAADLHRYLARRVGPAADDLVDDTFVAALRARNDYSAERGSWRAWLYSIATNLANNHVRRRVREDHATSRLASADRVAGHENQVVERVDAQVRAAQLAAAIALLPPGDRDVLLLSSFTDLNSQEIADALGVPAGTVRSRLHRVRRHLRSAAPEMPIERGAGNVD
ncbi:RNA polymerase sigma factor [Actinoplanes solisilvae]|uniref:RNA polymerase sigma factor n=1 Tax=Actinoplanes solisilvae TaxID=2486853 RepID=UPI000FDBFC01|nr:RNA polymerase sigma factor [Actinoplanes solisilvae]